jgi:hypothetical protein
LLAAVHPQLQKRKPDYDSLNKLARVRGNLFAVGLRPRLQVAVTYYSLGRLKSREAAAAMRHMEFRANEVDAVADLVPEAEKVVKVLKGRKMNAPRDAYFYVATLPAEMMAFIEVELPNPRAMQKLRNYIQKWRPLRQALPLNELDALGIARGPKFDKIVEQLFEMQLRGKGRDPEQRVLILRKLAGIKEEPKKKPEKEKKRGKDTKEAASGAKLAEKGKAAASASRPSAAAGASVTGKAAIPASGKAPSGASASIRAKAQEKHDKSVVASKKASPTAHRARTGPSKPRSAKKKFHR